MVLHDHEGAGDQVVAEGAGGGGENHGVTAGRDAGAERVDHSAGGEALVEMAAPAQDEDPAPLLRDRPGVGPVTARRVRREEGQRVERDGVLAGTQGFGGPGEAAAQDHEHVVVLGPEPAGQFPGALRRPGSGVLHGPMVEG